MTQTLIEELRNLHARSTDEGDRAILGALLAAEEAAKAEPVDWALRICAACKQTYPVLLANEGGLCPGCELLWMHDTFSRRRADAIKNGW